MKAEHTVDVKNANWTLTINNVEVIGLLLWVCLRGYYCDTP